MLETLTGLLMQVSNALSSGDGLRLLVYGNTTVLLAINSIAGRRTARKKTEALRNKALAAGGPIAKMRADLEYWKAWQQDRAELAKLAVERRKFRASRAESIGRTIQNRERSSYGDVNSARNIADVLKKAAEKRAAERDAANEVAQTLIVPSETRRTPLAGGTTPGMRA